MRMYVYHLREKSPFEIFQVARLFRILYIFHPDSVIIRETKYAIAVKKVEFENFVLLVDLLSGIYHNWS